MWRMTRFFGFCSIVTALLVYAPSDVLGQKKDKKAAPKDADYSATAEDYTKLRNVKELGGSMVAIDGAGKTLTLRVEIPHYEPNPNYKPPTPGKGGAGGSNPAANYQTQQQRLYQNVMNLQQQAMTARTPQELQRIMARIQADFARMQQQQNQFMANSNQYAKANNNPNNQPYKVVTTKKDFELDIKDDIVVRKLFLGTEYDDTGNIKAYTEKEKAALRGADKTKPGYTAKLEDVQPGQEVYLFLTPPKTKKKEKEKDKDAKAEEVVDMENTDRPTVKMIVMTKEMSMSSSTEAAPPKKDKKK